jgi:hypothetical protein
MAFKITKPIYQTFRLDYYDPQQPDAFIEVSFRQATTGDDVRVNNLFTRHRQIWNDKNVGEMALERDWNIREVMRFRCYLTMVACNLVDEDEKPIFRFKETRDGPRMDMEQLAFNAAWDSLPAGITDEIYEKCLEVNEYWNPNKAGE